MADHSVDPSAYLLSDHHPLHGWKRKGLTVGIAALIATVIGALFNREQFFQSYLLAFLFWLAVPLGSLGILMIHHIAGGRWGASLRRSLEAAVRTLPLLAVAFLPIIAGMHDLYHWTHADAVAHDKILQHKALYLNETFFLYRAAIYFVLWMGLGYFLTRQSWRQDSDPSPKVQRNLHFLSRGGIILYMLTMTFASIDWAMSADPHWFSHIYGVIFVEGQVLTAMAFMIPLMASIADRDPIIRLINQDRFHDLGKMLLAFMMLWAYFALSQYLIIWSGNIPEEATWYIHRTTGGWKAIGITLIIGHFALPFIILLSRNVKRAPHALAMVAGGLFIFRFVDLFWLIRPTFSPGDLNFHWLDLTCVLAIGGIWFHFFIQRLSEHPLIAIGDPVVRAEIEA